jgi:hypothetical protein
MVMLLRKMVVFFTIAVVLLGTAACDNSTNHTAAFVDDDANITNDNNDSDSGNAGQDVVDDTPPPKAIPAGLLPTLISTTSVDTAVVATDGRWLAWTGVDRQGITMTDGLETVKQTERLSAQYYPKEIAFDGRYTVFTTESDKQLFVVDNQDPESNPVLIADSADRLISPYIDQGELVWIDHADLTLYYVDLNSEPHPPVAITDGANRKIQSKIDDGLIVWSESIVIGSDTHWRVFYYDLKSATPTIVQPSGQTGFDHWMVNVHDRFIVWQGADAGPDVEIFYCDLRQNPLDSVQLTDNAVDDRHPQVENKIIVWDGSSAFENTVSYLDMNDASPSINQLPTAADYDNLSHFRDGVIAWTASSESFSQIFFYDVNDSQPGVVQITNDSFQNYQPRVAHGQIVWRTQEADGGRILAYNLVSTRTDPVADLPYSEIIRVLSENGRHVWLSKGLNRRLYTQLADGDNLNPVTVTPEHVDVGSLKLDNGIAVFRAFDGTYSQVYYCDLNADTNQLVKLSTNDNYNGFPRIEGDIVVWNGKDAGGLDQVYYADLSSASPSGVAIAVGGEFNNQCAVDDRMITWLGGSYPNYEVYYYDLNAPSPQAVNLTINTVWETDPKIDQGVVAWSRESSGNNTDVWYYDLAADTPQEVRVTDSGVTNDRIQAVRDRVLVWLGDNRDIFFCDLNSPSPAPVQVTTDAEWKDSLSVDDGRIVWCVNGEIHAYDIYDSNPAPIRVTENEINDFSPQIKGDFVLWHGDDLTYAARW